jgi:hypothetical protein
VIAEFSEFLESFSVRYERCGTLFSFPDRDVTIRLVPIDVAAGQANDMAANIETGPTVDAVNEATKSADGGDKCIYLYEDRWRSGGEVIRKRILAHLGQFRSIFARKCEVKALKAQQAADFLEKYHSYGTSRCKYRYGLFYEEKPVAVATFSAGRPMKRLVEGEERTLESYEWVRYASLPDCRISGGMGRLLEAFVSDVSPDEVMSYADYEWSPGDAYLRLGFKKAGEKPPMRFYVDRTTFSRISEKKVSADKRFRGETFPKEKYALISNLGSAKYLKQYV